MFRITFALDNGGDRGLAQNELAILLDAFVRTDMLWLRAHPEVRSVTEYLSQGALKYDPEPQGKQTPGRECWQDVPTCLAQRRDGSRGAGNRDLVAWRVAELRLKGVPATIALENQGRTSRAYVQLPNGSREYPAKNMRFMPTEARQRVSFVLDLFNGEADKTLSDAVLSVLLYALSDVDECYLRKHPEAPNVYRSGVRYMEEPPGQEDWQDVATCLRMGYADCDDLACWRAAELRVRNNVPARPIFKSKPMKNGAMLYHILTAVGQGRVEDPSYTLGMR